MMKATAVSKRRPSKWTPATLWFALSLLTGWISPATSNAQSQICGNQANQEIRAAVTNLFKFGFDEFPESYNDPVTFTNSVPPKRYKKQTTQGFMVLTHPYHYYSGWDYSSLDWGRFISRADYHWQHIGAQQVATEVDLYNGNQFTSYAGTAAFAWGGSGYDFSLYPGHPPYYAPWSYSEGYSGPMDTNGNWVVTSKYSSEGSWNDYDPPLWYPEPWAWNSIIVTATSMSYAVSTNYIQSYSYEDPYGHWSYSDEQTQNGTNTVTLSEEYTTDLLVTNTVTAVQGQGYPVDQDNQPLWSGGGGRAYNLISADELNTYAGKTQFRFSFESETNMGYWIAYEMITNIYDHGILVTGYSGLNIETGVIPGNGSNVYSQEYVLDVPPLGHEIIVGTCYIIPTNQPCVIFQPNPLFLCLSNTGVINAWVFPPQAASQVTYELQEDVPGVAQISAAGTNITVVGTAPGWATVLAKIGTNVIGAGAVAVAKVTFPTNTIAVSLNGTWTFDALVEPGSVPITFESSDTNVATVTAGGSGFTMNGLSLGTIQISARIGTNSICATAPAFVVDYTNATLIADRYLCEGGMGSAWVDLIPADALPDFTLTVTNSIGTNGIVADITGGAYPLYEISGYNYGDTKVEAWVGSNLVAQSDLTVVRIEFPVNTNGVIGIGLGNFALNTTILPREAPVTYYSMNTNVVVASGSGRHLDLEGITNGVAEVRARLGTNELCSSVGVTVTNPGVSVNLSFFPYLCEGASTPVTYTVNPPGTVTLDTADHSVAVISGSNTLVGVGYGETMVLALYNGIIAGSRRITVVHVDFPSSEETIGVDPLKPVTLHPTVLPESAAGVVNYSSENALISVAIGSGTNLLLQGISDGRTKVLAKIGTNQLCNTMSVIVTNGCPTCDSGKCKTFGSVGAGLTSVNVSISLGDLVNGKPAGFIRLRENNPSANLTTPAGLYVAADMTKVQAYYANGQLSQVRGPQGMINVRVINSTTFALDCYLKPALGGGGGPYGVGGLQLQNSVVFAGSANHYELTVTDNRNGQVESSYTFTWLPSNANWRLITGYKQEEIFTSIYGQNRTDTHSIYTYTNGVTPVLVSKAQRNYFQFPWGWALTQEVLDPDAAQVKTTYAYDAATARLLQVNRPDGSWEGYAYHTNGLLAKVFSPYGLSGPFANGAWCRVVEYDYTPIANSGDDGTVEPDQPRKTVEYVLGKEVSRSYAVILPGEEHEIRCATIGATWNNTNNLVTVTTRHTSGDFEGEIISILRPDGVMELRDYEITAQTNRVTTISVGQPDSGATAITNGITTITVTGPEGQLLSVTNRDIATSIVLGKEIYSNHDSYDRPQRVTYLDGTYHDTIFGCCGLDSERDRNGVTTTYLYDSLKRPYTAIRAGHKTVTTITVYDGAGNVLAVRRKGEDNSEIAQTRTTYDLAGRPKGETNALMGITTYKYGTNAQSLFFRSATNSDGGYRIETYQRDGSLREITGNTVAPVRYEVGLDGNQLYTKEMRLTAAGAVTDEQTKTSRDALGRTVTISHGFVTNEFYQVNGQFVFYDVFSAHTFLAYNGKGQLLRQTDPDSVGTMFSYNGLGEQEWAAIDMDRNWVMENYQGQDRASRTVRDVVAGASPYRRTQSYVLPSTNSGSTLLVGELRVSVDGLRQWQISHGLTNSSITALGANDYRTNTMTAPDGTRTVSTYHRDALVFTERWDATGGIRLGRADYTYDAHGRASVVTDARTGSVTLGYNAADLVTSSTQSPPVSGGATLVTGTTYDVFGRPTRITQPDGTTVTNDFHPSGALKKTYGSRTYPVEYAYDAQGRMSSMKTWQSFASGSGAAVTTWNYNPRRGWLATKRYQDAQGVDYGYSAAGRLTTRAWARGNPRATTTYAYDNAGDLSGLTYQNTTGPNVSLSRDRLGRVTKITQGTNVVNRAYNDAGQLLSEVYASGPLSGVGTTYTYDALLRRATLSATSSNTAANLPALVQTTYTYGSRGMVSNVAATWFRADYAYAADSTVTERVDLTDGTSLRARGPRTFDAIGRLKGIAWSNAVNTVLQASSYEINAAGQRWKTTLGDGSYWFYEYDALGQVKSGRRYLAGGQPVMGQQFDYQFDDIGNRRQANTGNGRRASYANNLLNEVESRDVPGYVNVAGTVHSNATVTINDQLPAAMRQGEYFFKEFQVLNLSSAKWAGLTNLAVLKGTGTNQDKQISQTGWAYVAQTPEFFGYDADGNLVSDGRWLYSWNGENRLVGMESIAGVPTAAKAKLVFEYDWLGRRTRKLSYVWSTTVMGGSYVLAQERRFVYDGWNLVAELDAYSGLVRSFTWGPDLSGSLQGAGGVGGLLGVTKWHRDGTGYYGFDVKLGVLGDGNGNVTGLVDMGTGTQVAWYEYGPFGEGLRMSGPWARENPFRFSTKYQDEETDLYYYGYRYYNPSTGRWLGRDPLEEEGGINLYGFVGNNSINVIDSDGRQPFSPFGWPIPGNKPLAKPLNSLWDSEGPFTLVKGDPKGDIYNNPRDLFAAWSQGLLPKESYFYEDSKMTQSLMNSPGVNKARNELKRRIKEDLKKDGKSVTYTIPIIGEWSYPPYKGAARVLSTWDWVQQFVGGFSGEIEFTGKRTKCGDCYAISGKARFHVKNTTTRESFNRHWTMLGLPAADNKETGYQSNNTQHYIWVERILIKECP